MYHRIDCVLRKSSHLKQTQKSHERSQISRLFDQYHLIVFKEEIDQKSNAHSRKFFRELFDSKQQINVSNDDFVYIHCNVYHSIFILNFFNNQKSKIQCNKIRSTILKIQYWFVLIACWRQRILKLSRQKNRKSVRLYIILFEFFDFSWFLILFCQFYWSFKLKQLFVDKTISISISVFVKIVSRRKTFFAVVLMLV